MPSEQFEHIQRIRQTYCGDSEISKTNQNNAIELLAEDLYKKNTHFIFELIQNAEDNTYEDRGPYPPYISFRLTKTDPTGIAGSDGALIIQNNETGFNRANVDAICALGGTTKKEKAKGYIGEKGIGFKSVFRVTKNPHIFSNGYHFCLPEYDEQVGLGYIIPQWVDTPPEGLDPSQTHIILPLTKTDFGYDKIEEMLHEIEPETVLFLSKLQEIRIETDTGTDLAILKNADAMPKIEVLVEGNKQARSFSTVDNFLVCKKNFHKPANIHHEKREKIESRDVSIAFPLDENSTGFGKIFAYLPVRSDTSFPFLINADFILTSSREDIQQDVSWNSWLMECVADLVALKLLPLLKGKKLLTVSFLETLANKLNNIDENEEDLFYPIFERVCKVLMNEELLPANDDDTFISASNAKLARGDAIRNLLNHDQLGTLFSPTNDEIKWLSSGITQDRTLNLRQYLMKLGVEEVTPPMFANKLSEPFLATQSDEWFVKFYRFLSAHSAVLRSLLTKPILRLQNGTHVNPFREKGSPPNAYLPIGEETDTSLPILKVELFQDEEARKFLIELDIPKWDIVEEVIEQILPKYRNKPSTALIAEYIRDFPKIVSAYATDSQKKERSTSGEVVGNTLYPCRDSTRERANLPKAGSTLFWNRWIMVRG